MLALARRFDDARGRTKSYVANEIPSHRSSTEGRKGKVEGELSYCRVCECQQANGMPKIEGKLKPS